MKKHYFIAEFEAQGINYTRFCLSVTDTEYKGVLKMINAMKIEGIATISECTKEEADRFGYLEY